MIVAREAKAKSTLGLALIKNLLVRAVRPRGLPRWLGRLAEENLAPATPEIWARLEPSSRCIACGLCDVVDPDGESFSAILTAGPRRPQDAPLFVEAAQRLADRAEAIAAICPTGVPAEAVAALILENAAALGATAPEEGTGG